MDEFAAQGEIPIMNHEPTVLVADDASMMGELLRTILRGAGCRVVASVTNGEDAVRAFHRFHPELVLLDIGMPGKDGMEVLQEILGNAPQAFVVIISGDGRLAQVKRAQELGARAFLVKPVNAVQVNAVVDAFRESLTTT